MFFDCYITFRSVTSAQRGAEALRAIGIQGTLIRTPAALAAQGCGYSLRIRGGCERAAWELRRQGIAYTRIFRQSADGRLEAVSP